MQDIQKTKRKLQAIALTINRFVTRHQGRLVKRYGAVASLGWAVLGLTGGATILVKGDKLNEMGDFFAGWFSPLAFAWFVYAVFLQMKELKATNETMNLQKEELEGSKLALREQSKALSRQNVENTFFNMVKALGDIIGGMSVVDKQYTSDGITGRRQTALDIHISGRAALSRIFEDFWYETSGNKTEAEFTKKYEQQYNVHGNNLAHYYRMLNRIIEFVDQHTELEETEKNLLIKILRSHLSDSELYLLFVNSFYKYGKPMVPYIKKYEILDNFILKDVGKNDILITHAKKLNVTVRDNGDLLA